MMTYLLFSVPCQVVYRHTYLVVELSDTDDDTKVKMWHFMCLPWLYAIHIILKLTSSN